MIPASARKEQHLLNETTKKSFVSKIEQVLQFVIPSENKLVGTSCKVSLRKNKLFLANTDFCTFFLP